MGLLKRKGDDINERRRAKKQAQEEEDMIRRVTSLEAEVRELTTRVDLMDKVRRPVHT